MIGLESVQRVHNGLQRHTLEERTEPVVHSFCCIPYHHVDVVHNKNPRKVLQYDLFFVHLQSNIS